MLPRRSHGDSAGTSVEPVLSDDLLGIDPDTVHIGRDLHGALLPAAKPVVNPAVGCWMERDGVGDRLIASGGTA
jgi:hypothetical protein